MTGPARSGPLHSVRVVEMAGLGPGPFAGMVLADLGADVVRIDRVRPDDGRSANPGGEVEAASGADDLFNRGKRSISVDLKQPDGIETVLRLVEGSDVLTEGYRPGVMERLGLGPDPVLARNPGLVYGRMTGWGQQGPLAGSAGHDINYLSVAGALAHIGRAGAPPTPPANLGDFGAGSMFLAFGIVSALVERAAGGRGQVVDASILDGAAMLMSGYWSMNHAGLLDQEHRGTNMLDSGSYFYDAYRCRDGEYVSIASAEPTFYDEFLRRCGLADDPEYAQTLDRDLWPARRARFTELFATRTRAEWAALLEGTDACVAQVLRMDEAVTHPHNAARATFVQADGRWQPAPAPRLDRTPGAIAGPPCRPGADTTEVLLERGFDAAEVERLRAARTVQQSALPTGV